MNRRPALRTVLLASALVFIGTAALAADFISSPPPAPAPILTGDYRGQMMDNGTILSPVQVPEPSPSALLALGGVAALALGNRLRRK
ncbi:MAG: PEP-CTERM sorting domain-containing protein [Verrucomicrobiota bacterium]